MVSASPWSGDFQRLEVFVDPAEHAPEDRSWVDLIHRAIRRVVAANP
jgi:hypothetical protein